jgi:hypothetical protein
MRQIAAELLRRGGSAYASAPPPFLTWEETLASMRQTQRWRQRYGWNDFGAIAVFALLAAGSIALGAYRRL